MNNIYEKLIFDMQLSGMSEVTQKKYAYHIKKFEEYCNKPIEETDINNVREFLHYLRNDRELSIGTVNDYHTGIKFAFCVTLEKPWNDRKVPRLRGYKTLPVILSKQEVKALLNAIENIKHKAILSTVYSSGLRVSEACRLKVKDIDSKTMQIFIRKSKYNKDRYTILSKTNLLLLRKYWISGVKSREWLFPGLNPEFHIAPESVRSVLKSACKKAGIKKEPTIHTLRHCFATHMLESGMNICVIQKLLGHACINSTARYLHIARPDAFGAVSPLDIPEDNNEC
jgi:integrase/recombinase XerD